MVATEGVTLARKVIYFTANFNHDFIQKVWADDLRMAAHLNSKLISRVIKSRYVTPGDFILWFFELSKPNQEKLITWIDKNYKNG